MIHDDDQPTADDNEKRITFISNTYGQKAIPSIAFRSYKTAPVSLVKGSEHVEMESSIIFNLYQIKICPWKSMPGP